MKHCAMRGEVCHLLAEKQNCMSSLIAVIFLGSKIIADGDTTMKLRDACYMKEKL